MSIHKVLAATDGTDHGGHAARFARSFSSAAGAVLDVLGVDTGGLPALVGADPGYRNGHPVEAVTWVRGVPGVEIVRRADDWGADLLVLGRRERTLTERHPLGRTADTVVRRRDGPTLFVPLNITRINHLLVALDGTQRGLGVLPAAEALLHATGARPGVVCVLPAEHQPLVEDPRFGHPTRDRLLQALDEFPTLGGRQALHVSHGEPVSEILAMIEKTSADALVIGVRRGGPRGEMGSGHVGRDLLQTAPVAILTVAI